MGTHPGALFSIAVIQFNGSGGSKNHMNIRAGALLCTRAASYGHIDALRELGHCLQDGYGLRQNVALGRRLLIQANARELAADLFLSSNRKLGLSACSLLSDYGYNVPTPVAHPRTGGKVRATLLPAIKCRGCHCRIMKWARQ
ncbi:hypothetical protein HPP92_021054 [Vanilla planifolia]|uniref:Uncharacterized protein n=1 Tax=Vanilla planifolia TaxID=51239 RepID=A0A835UIF1_VANPL|nr:hypothetical protein HPP92_021054 [Vanilla planifolia]